MPKFTGKSGGGPSVMKKYGQGKNPMMMGSLMKKDDKKKKKSPKRNYKKGYYGT